MSERVIQKVLVSMRTQVFCVDYCVDAYMHYLLIGGFKVTHCAQDSGKTLHCLMQQ